MKKKTELKTEDKIISKRSIQELVVKWLQSYELYTPIKDNSGAVVFSTVKSAEQIFYEYCNSTRPPKQVIFPQSEVLFKFQIDKGIVKLLPVPHHDAKNTKRIIFGLRPCDANSFGVLDKVFDNEYKDNYYLTRRGSTVLVGLSCNSPSINCFCTSIGGSPSSKDNLDMLFTDIGDKYYVEVITEKARGLLKNVEKLFSMPSEKEKQLKNDYQTKAEQKIIRRADTTKIAEKLSALYGNVIWDNIGNKCIGCGICTYLCPTCYCFDLNDEYISSKRKGARVRTWDHCMHQLYSLHASGHNPRPSQRYRVRNRIMHKFKYYPENFNAIACVGCGRCIEHCPVNIDLIDILKTVTKSDLK